MPSIKETCTAASSSGQSQPLDLGFVPVLIVVKSQILLKRFELFENSNQTAAHQYGRLDLRIALRVELYSTILQFVLHNKTYLRREYMRFSQ